MAIGGAEPGRGSRGVPDRGVNRYSCYILTCMTGVVLMGGGVCVGGMEDEGGGPLLPARLASEALRGLESQCFADASVTTAEGEVWGSRRSTTLP